MRLAWRVAAGGAGAPEAVKCEQVKFFLRTGFSEAALEKWLVRLGRDESWLDEMVSLEATYRRECEALLTREACERMLNALRIPLTRMELETIDLESRAAAREAYLCIREDGLPMADVAKSGRYPYRRAEIVCEDLAAESQRKILCAAPGEVLEPIERGDGFQLCRLIQKIEPTLSDAPTRVRIEQRILERHFSELAAGRIVWMIPPSSIHDRASR